MGIKAVRYEASNAKPKPPCPSSCRNPLPPKRPCNLCTSKGFQSNHYPPNSECGAAKLSSPDILKLISDNKVCPSCIYTYDPAFPCRLTFHNGQSKVCPRGCQHDVLPDHHRACMHNNHTPTVSMSKSIPLVENIPVGTVSLGIQYNTGCQLSLISQSALQVLPTSMYSRGTSTRVRVLGQGNPHY